MDWYIECGGVYNINNQKIFGRKIYINPSEMEKTIKNKFNNIDVYSTAFMYNAEDQNESDIIGPLYLDLDGDINDEESYQIIKKDALLVISFLNNHLKVPKDYIRIYFSGNKGFHFIIPHTVFGIKPCKDLNDKYKAIALLANSHTINKCIDTRIYDKKRLLRLPHSINGKTNLYKVPISEDMLRIYNYEQMKIYASVDRNIDVQQTQFIEGARMAFETLTKKKEKTKRDPSKSFINPNFEIPVCIKYIYATGSVKGMRNNTLMILASALLQKGIDVEEVIEMMIEWDSNKNEEALGDREVETTVRSAYRNLVDGRRYGCASIKELGLCVGHTCKIYR